MNSVSKTVGIALLLLSLASPVYAQVCMEQGTSPSGKANMACDMSYRNTQVACDADGTAALGTRPSCPPKPMPMITTPNLSYMWGFTPYLWQYPRDAADPSLPYDGPYALGTPGDTSRTFQLFGNTAPGTKRIASCTAQIHLPSTPTSVGEWAKLIRLQVDNCTNQYLVEAAMYPVQKDASKLLSMDDLAHPSKTINTASECQPLKTFSETENEYSASHYLQVAWQKMMQNPNVRVVTPGLYKCVPCLSAAGVALPNEYCDHEPHLPCNADPLATGTTIDNAIAPPNPFPEVLLSSISKVQVENINDPTHPFSPRWDFELTDRDYSNLNFALLASMGQAKAVLIQEALQQYMSPVDNSVFCAGVKKADSETDAKKKADDLVEVDVLSFRKDAFENALFKRTAYNAACYMNPTTFPSIDHYPTTTAMTWAQLPAFIAGSWCFNIDGPYFIGYVWAGLYVHNKSCWECFNLSGKLNDDGDGQHPPCATEYLGKDLMMKGVIPGGLNLFNMQANCMASNIGSICSALRRPYTNLNVLKMRYYRTDDPDDTDNKNNSFINGAAEGLRFNSYFGNHMPYPRMWDMGGVSLQSSPATDSKFQPPTDTTGQYTAIVGIGREGATQAASDAAGADSDGLTLLDKHPDERCLAGGWGPLPATTVGGTLIPIPDPVTSWTEMKLYEARTLRNVGMSCLGRYEKVFKPGSAENMLLLRSGGMWQQLIVTKCDKGDHGITSNCTTMTYKEYMDAGAPATTDTVLYIKNLQTQNIPQPWRGYESALSTSTKFPLWGNGTPALAMDTGLESAGKGDIILEPFGPSSSGPGLAKLAFVIETRLPADTDCADKKDCYVRVLEPDDGKWPDSCGSTDTWGEMKTRYYYKPGMLPYNAQKEYSRISSTGDCIETKISHCEQSAWSSLMVYHIPKDIRTGCQHKDKGVDCTKDE